MYSPLDFDACPDPIRVAEVMTCWLVLEYNWDRVVLELPLSRAELTRILQLDQVQSCIKLVKKGIQAQIESRIEQIALKSGNNADVLKAAEMWLSAHDAEFWDKGVRKEAKRGELTTNIVDRLIGDQARVAQLLALDAVTGGGSEDDSSDR